MTNVSVPLPQALIALNTNVFSPGIKLMFAVSSLFRYVKLLIGEPLKVSVIPCDEAIFITLALNK